jgi:excinuclease ABC subunit C
MVRTCSDAEFKSRKRPCLKHQIKLCSAPCTGLISKQDYNLKIKDAIAFLSGKSLEVKNALIKQMNQLSDELKFEEAIATRNKIELITKIQGKGEVNFTEYKNTDVVCIHRVAETVGVQVFFLRDGMSFGSKVFFPSVRSIVSDNIEDISLSEVLEAFLMQFYCENQVPEEILLNHEITNIKNIEIAISNTKILTPKKGLKLDLVNFTLTNLLNQIEKELLAKAKTSENLHKLKETFNLPKIPQKIEVFDNSHISGSNFIGAMIVAGPEGFIKKEYRKYNAKFDTTKAGDDYAMMAEVMKRRYKSAPAETLPDLILIDGGIGQLSVVKKTFDEIGITVPFICISKGPNRNAGEEKFHTPLGLTNFSLPKNSSLLFYLQNLRDEVHRFAIGTYRKRHQKSFLSSSIDDIKGIGKARKKALLNHFGSFELIKKAKPEDLMKVSGISKEIAMQMSEINK